MSPPHDSAPARDSGHESKSRRRQGRGSPEPASQARLLPRVTFGLGAAVLAGVALVPGLAPGQAAAPAVPAAVTVSLGAPINPLTCATSWCLG